METICQALDADITTPGTVTTFSEKQLVEILKNRNHIACSECGGPVDNRWSEKYEFYLLCRECGFAFKFDLKTLQANKVPHHSR